jgi:hypothetical protein
VSDADPDPVPPLDPDSLKSRFKKICERTNNVHQNWQVRVHRSLSWSKRAAAFPDDQPEARFLYLWIALNSLWARWNNRINLPDQDSQARGHFLRRLAAMQSQPLAQVLRQNKPLLKKLLSDPYLCSTFWANPDHPDAKKLAADDVFHLDARLKDGRVDRLLGMLLARLSVLRGQIVHGASTGGSRLNRSALGNALSLLAVIVPMIQHLVIEHGCGDDWPDLCYPPMP